MPNYKLTSNMVLLDSHIATGTEASYTYTPAAPLLPANYPEIYIVMSGVTTATLALELIINALTDYNWSSMEHAPAGIIHTSGSATSEIILATTGLINGAQSFGGYIKIRQANITGSQITFESKFIQDRESDYVIGSTGEPDKDGIDSIKIETSTSTWLAGTQIMIYGITS